MSNQDAQDSECDETSRGDSNALGNRVGHGVNRREHGSKSILDKQRKKPSEKDLVGQKGRNETTDLNERCSKVDVDGEPKDCNESSSSYDDERSIHPKGHSLKRRAIS